MIIAVQSGRIPQLTGHETKSVIARDVAPRLAVSIVQAMPVRLHTDDGGFAWGQLPRESLATTLVNTMSNWIDRLGGVRRIIAIAKEGLTSETVHDALMAHLPVAAAAAVDERLLIGLSADDNAVSARALQRIGHSLKKRLQAAGVRARIVFPSSGTELSAAAIKHNRLTGKGCEWVIGKDAKGLWLGRTLAAYDPDRDAWLDRGIPKSDAASGMLPPKLARMMVNCAVAADSNLTVVDPFCGNGRVLLEALLLGYAVQGSDNDAVKVAATEENITWLRSHKSVGTLPTSHVSLADAQSVYLPAANTWVAVAEPWLGPALRHHPSQSEATALANDVRAVLYPTVLHILEKAPLRAVIIAPAWQVGSIKISTEKAILDAAQKTGYHTECIASVARDDSFVTRDVILITKDGA